MSNPPPPERQLPSRGQALVFQGKACLLQLRRSLSNLRNPISTHPRSSSLEEAAVIGSASSELWTHQSDAEFPLTAGKVHNLRIACQALNGLEIPAHSIFSFWKQLGRVTRQKGYVDGRELREGCLVPNTGGGLCQLSNLLYSAALDAGLEIVERHAHSRIIPGSLAEKDRDATVFWNYVDLRFRADFRFRIETILTDSQLRVQIRANSTAKDFVGEISNPIADSSPIRSNPSGDCLTCGMISCFRNPAATEAHHPDSGHVAFLLDEFWPEFQRWCRTHSQKGDRWLTPIDGKKWHKPNYAWSPPDQSLVTHATLPTLLSAFRMRRIPSQGAVRQRALLKRDAALAARYGKRLDPAARHLIVSQNLLPHLWRQGHLGGRTFDVLMTRWPISELQKRLDAAAANQSQSTTLADFRAEPELARAEDKALAAAERIITPHRAIAAGFGDRALLLDWHFPTPEKHRPPTHPGQLFFPASPLGRKGVFELAEILKSIPSELVILGKASEGAVSPFKSINCRTGTIDDLFFSSALILPAYIEHRPRLALRALANGIPVIATRACGLPEHPQLIEIESPSAEHIKIGLEEVLGPLDRELFFA